MSRIAFRPIYVHGLPVARFDVFNAPDLASWVAMARQQMSRPGFGGPAGVVGHLVTKQRWSTLAESPVSHEVTIGPRGGLHVRRMTTDETLAHYRPMVDPDQWRPRMPSYAR